MKIPQTWTNDYLECACWVNEEDEDYIPPTREQINSDLVKFDGFCRLMELDLFEIEKEHSELSIGHDLYLTRNGHGAGFWDRGLGQLGDKLTMAAHAMGESQ